MPIKSTFPDVEIEEISFHDYILRDVWRWGNEEPDRVALIAEDTGKEYTHVQVYRQTQALISSLHKLGFGYKDVMVFALPNSVEYVLLSLAVMSRGGAASGVNPVSNPAELNRQISDSKAAYVCMSQETTENVLKAINQGFKHNIKCLIYVDIDEIPNVYSPLPIHHVRDLISAFPEPVPPVKLDVRNDLCYLPYSSGTTGPPKGVMLSHYGQVAVSIANGSHTDKYMRPLVEAAGQNVGDSYLIGYLPMYHIYGFMMVYGCLRNGNPMVIMKSFDPLKFLEVIQKYKVPFLSLVPPIAQFLAKHPIVDNYDLSSVKMVFCGAAPLKQELENELRERHPSILLVGQGYGMTETGIGGHVPGFSGKPGNAGILGANMIMKIVDPKTGEEVGEGVDGEICFKGPSIMKGYLNRPEANKEIFDKDGFLKTGDIGHYDGDYVYVVDRIKELIKVNAFQVAPAELESCLMSHPAVADAAVIGIPDDKTGEAPRAFVVLKPDARATAEQIAVFVEERVSRYKRLTGGVHFIEQVPKSAAGKILRRELREMNKRMEQGAKL